MEEYAAFLSFSCPSVFLEGALITFNEYRESALELVQRYRRDRQVLLNFLLSGSLIKKVVMPPGAVSLDDVNLDQVSVDYVLNCAKQGSVLILIQLNSVDCEVPDFPAIFLSTVS